jgi:hypothetical protein
VSRAGRTRKVGLREPNGQLQRCRAVETDLHAIYVVECGTHVKVGRAKSPAMRLSILQIGNPQPAAIAAVFPVSADKASKLESAVHRTLKAGGTHERGEWYRVSSDLAAQVVLRVAAEEGIALEMQNLQPAARDTGNFRPPHSILRNA